ncbi:hypothetical protein BDW71DRAFT_185694 [Aspergillus fruticulosus]
MPHPPYHYRLISDLRSNPKRRAGRVTKENTPSLIVTVAQGVLLWSFTPTHVLGHTYTIGLVFSKSLRPLVRDSRIHIPGGSGFFGRFQ